MTVVLDAGALIAVERRDRRVRSMLDLMKGHQQVLRTSGGVVARVWRNGRRQANLARVLAGVDVCPLDEAAARRVGELLGTNSSRDVVDGHVALLATPGGTILTSDPDEIDALLRARGVKAHVVAV